MRNHEFAGSETDRSPEAIKERMRTLHEEMKEKAMAAVDAVAEGKDENELIKAYNETESLVRAEFFNLIKLKAKNLDNQEGI
ncbi:MAG TPA: hypothetical protein VLC46_21910 [Thermoanaerobaculia bacterium]|jgi:hypothetical protein|nr:hypothetical protein [Thermoanaerobaculia bacterium]